MIYSVFLIIRVNLVSANYEWIIFKYWFIFNSVIDLNFSVLNTIASSAYACMRSKLLNMSLMYIREEGQAPYIVAPQYLHTENCLQHPYFLQIVFCCIDTIIDATSDFTREFVVTFIPINPCCFSLNILYFNQELWSLDC